MGCWGCLTNLPEPHKNSLPILRPHIDLFEDGTVRKKKETYIVDGHRSGHRKYDRLRDFLSSLCLGPVWWH